MSNIPTTMAFTDGTPWHGLGTDMKPDASVDEWQVAAGVDWTVSTKPLLYRTAAGLDAESSHFALVRDDTDALLDVIGKRYIPVQNSEVLQFFKDYVDAGDMSIETVGSLSNGKYIWALAKMGEAYTLPGNDTVGGYVLLANPHQYGKSATLKFTQIRVVCENTLTNALKGGASGVRILHTSAFDSARRKEAQAKLGIAREMLHEAKEEAEDLVDLTLSQEDAVYVFAKHFNPRGVDEPLEQQSRTVKRLAALYSGEGIGSLLPSAAGTAWGVLNAVTQYLDHEYGRSADARIMHAWMGKGEAVKLAVKDTLLDV